jgi:hypothetical protein
VRRAALIIALAASPVFADDVFLRGGGQITGEIVEQTAESVTVDIGGGTISAPMSSVVRIEQRMSPLQEYRQRAAAISDGDAEAWRALARWATTETLSSQAWEAWEQVLAVLPEDEEANHALGRVRMDGRWVSREASYRARGYVEFEGEWVTPEERDAIRAERRAREDAERDAIDAEVAAIEDAQQAERDRREAEVAEFRRGELPRYGDSVYWGWGSGPTTWPAGQPRELSGSVDTAR